MVVPLLMRWFKRGLQTFLSKGRISYYTTVRGLDILRNVIVSECHILPNQQIIRKDILFFH